MVVPGSHLPVISLARLQGRAAVHAIHGFLGRHPARVPQGSLRKALRGRGDTNLVSALHRAAPLGMQHPAEPWRRFVDADGVGRILRSKPFDVECLGTGLTGGGMSGDDEHAVE